MPLFFCSFKRQFEKFPITEQIIDAFLYAQTQMLEDTFVYAVKYAYEVFNEITK